MSNLPSVLPNSVDHVIENLTQPLTINVGNTFGALWYLVFGGISQAAQKRMIKYAIKLEKFKQETETRILGISPDDLKEPNTQIATQALEQSKYCIEEEDLRIMFSELIASSMMKSREGVIHPSYAAILAQMSNDDARALLRFREKLRMPVISVIVPIDTFSYREVLNDIWEPCEDLDSIEKSQSTLGSLVRLGLVKVSYLKAVDNSLYDVLYTEQLKSMAKELLGTLNYDLSMKKGIVELTDFGINFVLCVLSDECAWCQ